MLKENLYMALHGHSILVSVWSFFNFRKTVKKCLRLRGLTISFFSLTSFFHFHWHPAPRRNFELPANFSELWTQVFVLVCLCVCTLTHISLLQPFDHWGPIKKKRPHCPLLHFYRYQSSVSLISIHGGKESWKALEWRRERKGRIS